MLADFDLGNGNVVLVSESFAKEHGLLSDDRIVGTRPIGGIGGPVDRTIVLLESLTIAGKEFKDVEAAIDTSDDASDANIGVRLLKHFDMVIDFETNEVWLTPIP